MAVTLINTNGLFTRLGKLMGMASTVRASAASLRTEFADVISTFSDADMDFVGSISNQIENRINDGRLITNEVFKAARKTLIEMMDDDLSSGNGSGLKSKHSHVALRELIKQMESTSKSVEGTTITINTVSAGSSNRGDGTLVLSGLASQIFAPTVVDHPSIKTELITAECTEDSNMRTAPGSERFLIYGQRSISRRDEDWPRGSNTNFFLNCVNPNDSQGMSSPGHNVLNNSNFENFTSNTPDSWTITTGTAGADVVSTDQCFSGSKCLKIISNGSNQVELNQELNSDSGTLGRLEPDTLYTISFAIKESGTSPSSGNLLVRLWDGSNTLNNSDSNRKMEVSIASDDAVLTASFKLVTLACMTPKNIPDTVKLQIKLNTAFTNGTALHIDHLAVAKMHRPFLGGLGYQMISGATNFGFQDTFTSQIVNNGEGAMNTDFDRIFPEMQSLGYALPANYGGSETVLDNLIS